MGELANDDGKLKSAASTIYKFMPMPVRLVLSEEKFGALIVQHKAPLFEAIAKL